MPDLACPIALAGLRDDRLAARARGGHGSPATAGVMHFAVQTPALAVAAGAIGRCTRDAVDATAAARAAQSAEGAFGGEPIGAAFIAMCTQAQQATMELAHTLESLSSNVAAASVGYLTTDRGVIPMHQLPGFKP